MTELIDAYATMGHYIDHLAPVMAALPEDRRGVIYAPRLGNPPQHANTVDGYPPNSTAPLLVAGFQDLAHARRPKVLLNHGAGQTYVGAENHPSYDGGAGRELVDLFLCPNQTSADRNVARYPRARAVAVGCPKLDQYLTIPKPKNDPPVVAVAFHWPCHVAIESGWAFPTWRDTIADLARATTVLGHAHPRARQQLDPWYRSVGIEPVERPEELLARADVLVIDNSSFGFEWGACDRPTVWLDDETWRPDIVHGLRFGEQLPGPRLVPSLASRRELVDAINISIQRFVLARAEVSARVYGTPIRGAARRAADAILEWETDLHA